jgi:hypothetical protein
LVFFQELDANLLEERRNTMLSNVRKYQVALKRYYNKCVVQRGLYVGDLVLKKDIHTKDKHKFSSPWEGPFIVVDVVAPGAYVLAEVDCGMQVLCIISLYDQRNSGCLAHKINITFNKNLCFLHV